MRIAAVGAVLALSLASAAAGQLPPPAAPGPPHGRGQIFIAPSGEPFRAGRDEPYPVATWFAQADADHDGRVTPAEFTADFERFFHALDQDHDGRLRFAEINRYEQEVAPEVQAYEPGGFGGRRGHRRAEEGDSGGGLIEPGRRPDPDRPVGGGRFGLLDIPEPIASMDIDLNGIVTLDEVRRAALERFRLIDARQQGYLTLADLPKTWVQIMASREKPRHLRERRR